MASIYDAGSMDQPQFLCVLCGGSWPCTKHIGPNMSFQKLREDRIGDRMKIRDEFKPHLLNEAGLAKAEKIAGVFTDALDSLELVCGKDGREMALVRTHLQDASFWAKRAMAVRPENQKA